MADFVGTLVGMGFDRSKAEKAVEATRATGTVESAMEWIFNNDDKKVNDSETAMNTDADADAAAQAPNGDSKPSDPAEVVRSYKCNECQKILRNVDEMELHAAKTQHSDFQESTEEKKPLTEEEKKEQLRLIEEKLKVKRAEREAREKQENLEREKNRMKSGKELAEYKRQAEEREMKELVEARRREKIEDAKARARVKAQFAADREARKAKDSKIVAPEPEPASGSSSISSLQSGIAASKLNQDEPPTKKDYTETKLQIRLPNGKAMVKAFNSKESLAAVRLYVQLNRDDGLDTPFSIMTNFPKKTFQDFEYDMPLDALGLVPSAVLIVTKTV